MPSKKKRSEEQQAQKLEMQKQEAHTHENTSPAESIAPITHSPDKLDLDNSLAAVNMPPKKRSRKQRRAHKLEVQKQEATKQEAQTHDNTSATKAIVPITQTIDRLNNPNDPRFLALFWSPDRGSTPEQLIEILYKNKDAIPTKHFSSLWAMSSAISHFQAFGDMFLGIGGRSGPFLHGSKPLMYAISIGFLEPKSINNTSDSKLLNLRIEHRHNIILRAINYQDREEGQKSMLAVVIGRLIYQNKPTYWIVFMDSTATLYAFRANSVDKEEPDLCFNEEEHREISDDYDDSDVDEDDKIGYYCPWKFDKEKPVFGRDSAGLLAVKLGQITKAMWEQGYLSKRLVRMPTVESWSSAVVPKILK